MITSGLTRRQQSGHSCLIL